jgi:hypothetical protein
MASATVRRPSWRRVIGSVVVIRFVVIVMLQGTDAGVCRAFSAQCRVSGAQPAHATIAAVPKPLPRC